MNQYKSFSTTKRKIDTTLDGLKEVQRNIITLPTLNINFKSENYFQQASTYPILLNYEVDSFVNDNNQFFFIDILFENLDEKTIPLIKVFPVFYGISDEEITDHFIYFDEVWTKKENNYLLSLDISGQLVFRTPNIQEVPTFVNLYLIIKNNRLFYNV